MAASAGLGSYNTVLIRVDYDGCWREELLLILQDFQSANPGLSFEDDSVIDSHLAPWLALQAHKLKHIQPRYPILADMVSQIEQSGARYVYVGQFSNRQSYKTDLSASGKYLGVAKENQGFRYYEYNNKGTLNVAKISSVQALKLLWKFLQALLTPGADNLELKTVKLFPFLMADLVAYIKIINQDSSEEDRTMVQDWTMVDFGAPNAKYVEPDLYKKICKDFYCIVGQSFNRIAQAILKRNTVPFREDDKRWGQIKNPFLRGKFPSDKHKIIESIASMNCFFNMKVTPETKVLIISYDDRRDIIRALNNFYQQHPNVVPSNVNLWFRHYIEESIAKTPAEQREPDIIYNVPHIVDNSNIISGVGPAVASDWYKKYIPLLDCVSAQLDDMCGSGEIIKRLCGSIDLASLEQCLTAIQSNNGLLGSLRSYLRPDQVIALYRNISLQNIQVVLQQCRLAEFREYFCQALETRLRVVLQSNLSQSQAFLASSRDLTIDDFCQILVFQQPIVLQQGVTDALLHFEAAILYAVLICNVKVKNDRISIPVLAKPKFLFTPQ